MILSSFALKFNSRLWRTSFEQNTKKFFFWIQSKWNCLFFILEDTHEKQKKIRCFLARVQHVQNSMHNKINVCICSASAILAHDTDNNKSIESNWNTHSLLLLFSSTFFGENCAYFFFRSAATVVHFAYISKIDWCDVVGIVAAAVVGGGGVLASFDTKNIQKVFFLFLYICWVEYILGNYKMCFSRARKKFDCL